MPAPIILVAGAATLVQRSCCYRDPAHCSRHRDRTFRDGHHRGKRAVGRRQRPLFRSTWIGSRAAPAPVQRRFLSGRNCRPILWPRITVRPSSLIAKAECGSQGNEATSKSTPTRSTPIRGSPSTTPMARCSRLSSYIRLEERVRAYAMARRLANLVGLPLKVLKDRDREARPYHRSRFPNTA